MHNHHQSTNVQSQLPDIVKTKQMNFAFGTMNQCFSIVTSQAIWGYYESWRKTKLTIKVISETGAKHPKAHPTKRKGEQYQMEVLDASTSFLGGCRFSYGWAMLIR